MTIWAPDTDNDTGPSSKGTDVFYNRAMETDRDITVVLLDLLRKAGILHGGPGGFRVLDGMAATGVRGLRIAKEVSGCSVCVNEVKDHAVEVIKKNVRENDPDNVTVTLGDVRKILCDRRFDYIDIDPFGTPAPFVEYALYGIHRNGVLAITSTDTATLYGSYPKTCLRRYDSLPVRCYFSHESALRILAAYVIRKAAIRDLLAVPIFSYARDHYYRMFFRIDKGAKKAERIMSEIQYLLYHPDSNVWRFVPRKNMHIGFSNEPLVEKGAVLAGPLYTGRLTAAALAEAIKEAPLEHLCESFNKKEVCVKALSILAEEAKTLPFFLCTHELSRRSRVPPPPMKKLMEELRKEGITARRTYFSNTGFKLDEEHGSGKDPGIHKDLFEAVNRVFNRC